VLVPFTLAGDGGGSARLPAAFSGVCSFQPAPNLIPSVSFDAPAAPTVPGNTVAPLARNVRDCATVAQAIVGPDGRDPFCHPIDPPSYLDQLEAGIADWKFVWTNDFGAKDLSTSDEGSRVCKQVREAAEGFASLGATVEPTDEIWDDPFAATSTTGFAFSGAADLWTAGAERPNAEVVQQALEVRKQGFDKFRSLFRTYHLLLSPTLLSIAPTFPDYLALFEKPGETSRIFHWLRYPNWLGLPAMSIPAGFVDGLPVGLQIIGPAGSEDAVLRAAQALQAAFPRDERPPIS
jgi:Asp-tRNA(Asn)/Glu-tRNA(Gln) amidotransferase A subunit family amidase